MCLPVKGTFIVWMCIPESGDQDCALLNNPNVHNELVDRINQLKDAATWSADGGCSDPLTLWHKLDVTAATLNVGPHCFVPNYLLVYMELCR